MANTKEEQMHDNLIEDSAAIRRKFMDAFVATFSAFCATHRAWIAELPIEFSESFYEKMYIWDRISCDAREISFDDALNFLKNGPDEVFFLAESADCVAQDFCGLNSEKAYVATASAAALAECAGYEWYTDYKLFERGRYLADRILPPDLYVFLQNFFVACHPDP